MGGAICITHAVFLSPESTARFGFIISKAVGNAVTRNLVRRRMKSVVQQHLHAGFTGMEVVFRARPSSATVTYAELEAELTRSLRRLQRKQREEGSA